jgi:hypothetical protein
VDALSLGRLKPGLARHSSCSETRASDAVESTEFWLFECPSVILCWLARRSPMELGTAMLCTDWLDSRFSKTGTRSKTAL